MLTAIPDKYLNLVNDVNLPVRTVGPASLISIKKSVTPHLEIGYQFEYLQIRGDVKQDELTFRVKSQALAENLTIGYNFRKTDRYRPRYNYLLYYKIGAVSLKNDPREIVPEGKSPSKFVSSVHNGFLKNIAVLTGLGVELNHQLSDKLSLVCALEMSRNSDVAADICRIDKFFYHAASTVNNYATVTAGLCYTFNLKDNKKTKCYNFKSETEKRLIEYRRKHKKRKLSKTGYSSWYEQ